MNQPLCGEVSQCNEYIRKRSVFTEGVVKRNLNYVEFHSFFPFEKSIHDCTEPYKVGEKKYLF